MLLKPFWVSFLEDVHTEILCSSIINLTSKRYMILSSYLHFPCLNIHIHIFKCYTHIFNRKEFYLKAVLLFHLASSLCNSKRAYNFQVPLWMQKLFLFLILFEITTLAVLPVSD